MNLFLKNYYNSYFEYRDDRNTCDYREVIKYLPDFLLSFVKNSPLCIDHLLFLYIDNQTVTYNTKVQSSPRFQCSPTQSPIIFIPIIIGFSNLGATHSNSVIIDNRRKEIEHFEPNGSNVEWWPLINRFLYDIFTKLYPDYTYISTNDFCPIGPQFISQDNYCSAWNLLYKKTRIDYPLINRNHIIEYLISLSKQDLNHLIYTFICFLKFYGLKTYLLPALNFYDRLSDQYSLNMDDEFLEKLYRLAHYYKQTANYDSLFSLNLKYEIP